MDFEPVDPVGPTDDVICCPACGRFVLVVHVTGGAALVLDPSFVERRWIRSLVGPAEVLRHGFGPGLGTSHRCAGPEPVSRIEVLEAGEHLEN